MTVWDGGRRHWAVPSISAGQSWTRKSPGSPVPESTAGEDCSGERCLGLKACRLPLRSKPALGHRCRSLAVASHQESSALAGLKGMRRACYPGMLGTCERRGTSIKLIAHCIPEKRGL
ncbi:hypothetical protein WJX74_010071 [Apatococcus lobatus]